eukprot:gene4483-8920_t
MPYCQVFLLVVLLHHSLFFNTSATTFTFTVDTYEDIIVGSCLEINKCSLRQAFSHCLSTGHNYHRNCSIVMSPNAVVYLNSPISVQSKFHSISLDGNGSVIIPSHNLSSFGFLNIQECYSIHLHNITISGFSGNNFESIIHMNNVINSSFHHIKFHNNIAAHSHAIVVKNSSFFTMTESHFVDNIITHRGAILSLTSSTNMNIHSNIFEYNSIAHASSKTYDNNLDDDNYDDDIRAVVYVNNISYSTHTNNIYQYNAITCLHISNSSNNIFTNDKLLSTVYYNSVYVYNSHNIVYNGYEIAYGRGSWRGGGFYIGHGNDHIYIKDCDIHDNRVYGWGAGIYSDGHTTNFFIINTRFYYNIAEYDGGAISLEGSDDMYASTYIIGCHMYYNQAAFFALGGAIQVKYSSIFSMTNTVIYGNSAGRGGGIYIMGPKVDVTIENCTVIRNKALIDAGGIQIGDNVYNLLFINVNIIENEAVNNGGGIHINYNNANISLRNCSIFKNTAKNNGGAIYIKSSNNGLSMQFMDIYENKASSGAGLFVYMYNNNTHIQQSIFHNNIAKYEGGGIYFGFHNNNCTIESTDIISNTAQYNGGGICIYSSNELFTLSHTNIINNSVTSSGGGIFIQNSNFKFIITFSNIADNNASFGGGTYVSSYNPMVTIFRSLFLNNIAKFDGGAIYYNIENVDSYVSDCTFYDNSAFNNGGAIFLSEDNTNLYMNDTVIRSNQAVNSGGGIYIDSYNHNITLYKSTFSYNKAGKTVTFGSISIEGSGDGGATMLYFNNENFQIYYCTMYGNTATNKGGAVFLSAANNNFYVTHSNMSRNSALSGGGIALGKYNTHVTVSKCIFIDHYAVDGGAIAVSNNNDYLMISDNIISNNVVSNTGGGLLVFTSNFITIIRCFFTSNTASKSVSGGGGFGGGIYIHSCYDITISQTVFNSNTGESQGGGMFLSYSNILTKVTFCVFTYNNAPNGGGLGLGNFNSNITISSSVFSDNIAAAVFGSSPTSGTGSIGSGGGIFIELFNQQFALIDCTMTANEAENGGAIAFAGSSSDVVMENVQMTNNQGNVYGGALFFGQFSSGFILHKVIFQNNSAVQKGGSLYMDDNSNGIKMTKCNFRSSQSIQSDGGSVYINGYSSMISVHSSIFESNIAFGNGGAIYVYQYNSHLDISDSMFTSNTATLSGGGGGGGAIYFNDANTFIHITHCSFLNNSAGSSGDGRASLGFVSGFSEAGGAISISGFANYNISITKSLFSRNHAGDTGGALLLTSIHVVLLSELQFISNYVHENGNGQEHGGAVTVSISLSTVDKNELILRSCVFSNNSAGYGGAMSVTGGINVDITNNTFNANIARDSWGSAIFLTATTGCTVRHNTFRNNHANQMGSVYWTTNDMSEPEGLSDRGSDGDSKNIWQGNTALYGSRAATDLYRISSPSSITAYRYPVNNILPSIHVIALDYYDQEMILLDMESISVDIGKNAACKQFNAFLIGTTTESIYNGRVDFKSLIAYCAPNGYYDVIFTSSSLSLLNSVNGNNNGSSITRVYFPPCLKGDETVVSSSKCTCPANAKECADNDIVLNSGVWRISKEAFTAQTCPYEPACMGKNLTGETSCSTGYTGPYCNLCITGYYKSTFNPGKCEFCRDSPSATSLIIYIIPLIIYGAFTIGLVYFVYYISTKKELKYGTSDNRSIEVEVRVNHDISWTKLITVITLVLQDNFKIVVSAIQIVAVLKTNIGFTFSSEFSKFTNLFSWLDMSVLVNIVPISCTTETSDHTSQLIILTIGPIALSLIWLITYYIITIGMRSFSNHFLKNLRVHFVYIFLLGAYLILPGISKSIVESFPCKNVDPDGATGRSVYILSVDPGIDCTSDRYKLGVLWALVMIFVYPIGIPCMYYLLLYKFKDKIKETKKSSLNVHSTSTSTSTHKDSLYVTVSALSFLYIDYEPQFWYWEVVETFRKLALTAILSVISESIGVQLVYGILVQIIFVKVYAFYLPYESDHTDLLQEIAQYQKFSNPQNNNRNNTEQQQNESNSLEARLHNKLHIISNNSKIDSNERQEFKTLLVELAEYKLRKKKKSDLFDMIFIDNDDDGEGSNIESNTDEEIQ